jgi:hypothetical protein
MQIGAGNMDFYMPTKKYPLGGLSNENESRHQNLLSFHLKR